MVRVRVKCCFCGEELYTSNASFDYSTQRYFCKDCAMTSLIKSDLEGLALEFLESKHKELADEFNEYIATEYYEPVEDSEKLYDDVYESEDDIWNRYHM